MAKLMQQLRLRLRQALGAAEQPGRLAAAWSLGVAIGFSPLVGLHTAIALVLAFLLRLNRIDVVLGTLVINPWTMVVYVPSAVVVGSWITGSQLTFGDASGALLTQPLWRLSSGYARNVVVSWLAGATLCSLAAGGVTYLAVSHLVGWRRRQRSPVTSLPGSCPPESSEWSPAGPSPEPPVGTTPGANEPR